MSLIRRLAAPLWLRAHRLGSRSPLAPCLRIAMLHDVPPSWMPALEHLVSELAQCGLLVTPDQAASFLDGSASWQGRRVLLSFDDGFASNFHAAAMLARWNAKAVFFVCPALLDLPAERQPAAISHHVYEDRKAAAEGLMDWTLLERLAADGHAIGSHTMTHRRLIHGQADRLEAEEIAPAAEILTRRLGRADWFAYPFGDIASIDAAALAVIGRHHRFCRSGVRGPNRPHIHRLCLRSDNIDLGTSAAWNHLALEGGLDRRYSEAAAALDALVQP